MFDRLSRRQFIKLTGGFIAGTAAAGSLPLINVLRANAQNSTGYKVVGYFSNWAQYRGAGGKFLPDQIDPSLFTHINFAFGMFGFVSWSVDPSPTRTGEQRLTGDYTVQPVEWNDQTVLYPAIQSLKQKNPNLKTLLSIGGWSFNTCDDTPETAGTKYPYGPFTCQLFSKMAADPNGRAQFIQSAIDYAKQYGFDGIDLDWEYPAVSNRGGQDADYDNYLALLQEFRQTAGPDFLITAATAAVPKGSKTGDSFFQWLAQCAQYLDWFNVMSYDYHGAFDDPNTMGTGANAPLLQDSVPNGTFDIKNTVESYLKASIPKEKIVLGLPTYGRSYVIEDRTDGFGKPFSSAGPAGSATATPGILAYYEILEKIANGELDVQKWDDATLTLYAYSTKTGLWVSYDDPQSLGYKVSYLTEKELEGAMVWAIDMDSFPGQTQSSLPEESTNFPLMNAIKGTLDNPTKRVALPVLEPQDGSSVGDGNFGEATFYDIGVSPSVALNSGNVVVEVHKNADTELYFLLGKVEGDTIKFGKSQKYDNGVQPSVAISNDGTVVEVHKSQKHNSLWCHSGRVEGDTIKFGKSKEYADGVQPSVAISNDGKIVVEVHKSQSHDTLWFSLGQVVGNEIKFGTSQKYDDGVHPSVAITNDGTVVEVHQSKNDNFGKVHYRIGKVVGDTIEWGESFEYESGAKPSVAISNDGAVVEVHQSELDDTVWYRGPGQVNDKTISWRNEESQEYSNGIEPRVTCNGELAVATHANGEELFYSVLTLPAFRSNWIELRGENFYCYSVCRSATNDKQRHASSHTMKIEAGTPYFYAVITKDENSVDFPTGAILTVTAPDGTSYNRDLQEENLLVIMSGPSVRCLIVKDPQPGDWKMTMAAREGVGFHCECNTVPSQDPYETITNTLSPKIQLVKRSFDSGADVTGWLGAAATGAVTGAVTGFATAGPLGGLIGAVVGEVAGNLTSLMETLFTQSPTPTTQIAATLAQTAQSNSSKKKKKPKVFLLQVSSHAGFNRNNKREFTLPGPNWQVRFFSKEPALLDYQLSIHIADELAISDVEAVNRRVKETVYSTINTVTDYELWDLEDSRYPSGTILVGDQTPTIDIAGTPSNYPIQFSTLLELTQRELDIQPDDKVVVYFNACRCQL